MTRSIGFLGLGIMGQAMAQRRFEDNVAHGEADLGTQAMFKALERAVQERRKRDFQVS